MELADALVRWSSVPAKKAHMPTFWGVWKGDALCLKDTRGKYWRNELVSPNTFVYTYPTTGHRTEREATLVAQIHARLDAGAPLAVHLFATQGSRDEFYGEWLVTQRGNAPHRHGVGMLTLTRLAAQSTALLKAYTAGPETRFRSANEKRHGELLDALFPVEEWVVRHEPETLMDLHDLSVVDGRAVDVVGTARSYTCDFVVASRRGCARMCIESKPHVDHVTPEAMAKARMLRDRTCTRVVFMVGEGANVQWIDLGPPPNVEQNDEAQDVVWHDSHTSLFDACGVAH